MFYVLLFSAIIALCAVLQIYVRFLEEKDKL